MDEGSWLGPNGPELAGSVTLSPTAVLEAHEKRRGHGRRWWECRYCHLGAVGSASVEAERAECLGHEAICPDQDRVNTSIPRTALTSRPRSAISPGDPDWVPGFGPVPGAGFPEDDR